MVTVPTYKFREVQAAPEFQQGIDVRANANAFGAAQGQGLQQIGQGLGQAADAMAQFNEFKDRLAAKDALTAFEREKMELDYGPNGYLTTQGRNAAEGKDAYYAKLDELQKKHGSSLKGGAARAYGDASTSAVTSARREGIVHAAQGHKDWAASTSTARLATFQDQAMLAYQKPEAVKKSIAAGFMEIDAQADLMGWGPEVVAVKRQEFATSIHSNVALAMAKDTGGATRAIGYLAKNADTMDPATRMELESKLKPYANDEAALSVVNEIIGSPRAGASSGGTVGGGGPTAIRAKLYERAAAAGKGTDHVDGLSESFAANLNAMFEDAPPEIRAGLQIGSGYRSVERQQQLWDAAVVKYGSEAAARKWVAPPGRSQHNHGNAVDIWYNGVRLDKAPAEVKEWVHANAGAYGLRFPMSWEAWHIEPTDTRGGGGTVVPARDTVSVRASMASYDEAMARVNAIQDPEVRASAMKQLNAQIEMRSKAEGAAAAAAKSDIWSQVAQGVPLSQIPLDLKIAAGREAVQGFMDYEAKAGDIQTDPVLHRDLSLFAATNPVEFARVDLTAPEIINGISKTDLKSLVDKQASALTDERKAREEGLNVTQAMTYARTQLDAVGITTTGLQDSARQEAAAREARFQMALADEMRAFTEANNGKQPTQMDIMQMTNRLLLPIVVKTPGTIWDSEQDGLFSFEASGRADGTTVDVVVEYADIPIDLRRGIATDLERELGRKPSEDEIVQRYEEFVLSR